MCVWVEGGCSFGMCSFRSSDVLFLAIWQNFCITDAITTTVKFFWWFNTIFFSSGLPLWTLFLQINWLFYLKLKLLASLSHRRNIPPDKKESYLKSCTYNPKTDPLCPIIKLGTIVKEAGEDYNKLAYKVKKNVLSTKICVIYKIPWWR